MGPREDIVIERVVGREWEFLGRKTKVTKMLEGADNGRWIFRQVGRDVSSNFRRVEGSYEKFCLHTLELGDWNLGRK